MTAKALDIAKHLEKKLKAAGYTLKEQSTGTSQGNILWQNGEFIIDVDARNIPPLKKEHHEANFGVELDLILNDIESDISREDKLKTIARKRPFEGTLDF